MESLERRQLLAYTVPEGFFLDEVITVPTTGMETSPFEIPANETVLLVSRETANLTPTRLLDAEFAQLSDLMTWATSSGGGFDWGIRSTTVTLNWGNVHDAQNEYGIMIAAESETRLVSLYYADDFYPDNSGELPVEIWRQVTAPKEPPPTCGCGSKGVGPTSPLGDTRFSTGVVATGSGGGITPSVGVQWNQGSTDSDGLGGMASGGEFGDAWSRNDIAKLVMHGDDPADPDFVSVVFSGDNARVFRSSPDGSGGVAFVRANGLGPTDTLSFESGRYVFRSADATVLNFNGFGASVPSLARGALVSQADASGNLVQYFFNSDGSINRLESFVAGQTAPVEIQQYVYLPVGDLNGGKVARIDIKRGDGTLVRSVDFSYHGSSQASVGVSIDYVTIGNPGNTGNTGSSPAGMGAVAETFRMGATEVTNAQYVAFLNAVDASGVNPRSVYD
jgi:hypothetical protein